ncbi:hypothetical protein LJC63_10800 [Ruminococcaceae bacterium OttesenSCG-928-L11]|nr:hypothetical protein [Ruminococcaceae bacterium OttesenSCG-928-L11]
MSKPKTTEQRDYEYDIKYLRKVLSGIDENIALPPSLSAEALRSRLDLQEQQSAAQSLTFSAMQFLRSRVFSLQSVISYALAFAVIVAVAYSMQFNAPDIVDGTIAITANTQVDQAMDNTESVPRQAQESQEAPAALFSTPEAADALPPAESASTPEPEVTGESPAVTADALPGVGGAGEATALGEDDAYLYLARENDPADPDKEGFPLTLEIVSRETELPVWQLDMPIETVQEFYTRDGVLSLTGEAADGRHILLGYAIGSPEEAAEPLFETVQQGTFLGSKECDGILYTLSTDTLEDDGDYMTELLPDSTGGLSCLVTAVDLHTGAMSRYAFTGMAESKEISLYNRNIYISYAATGEEGESELYMVQIPLGTMELEAILIP